MEVYLSEEERVDALKKWVKENYRSAIVGVALGLAVMGGWNAWQTNKRHKAEEASALYQNLLKAVEAKQTDPAKQLSQRLVDNYQGTLYATYGALFQAKLKVEAGDLAGAKQTLADLLNATKDDAFKHVIRIRLANVLLALGEAKEALGLIEPLPRDKVGEFESVYEVLKGDAYVAVDRVDDARKAYEKAKQLGDASPGLQLKLDNLAVDVAKPVS
ncbi:tetratricopeptide repeat protein [Methylococcus sp. EFPC2]|uniref:YfgM family protein n=1 Tax=Methylococcus sp. EFPC2 TaxID=2812648 RepID=UPI00196746E2|nr:tetratricopeptide repeat protein [Methylococcus sp. EFPC2]QSA96964.1 tetratricopeptide repeat protein [Methylococcus sp. EFPC2]